MRYSIRRASILPRNITCLQGHCSLYFSAFVRPLGHGVEDAVVESLRVHLEYPIITVICQTSRIVLFRFHIMSGKVSWVRVVRRSARGVMLFWWETDNTAP